MNLTCLSYSLLPSLLRRVPTSPHSSLSPQPMPVVTNLTSVSSTRRSLRALSPQPRPQLRRHPPHESPRLQMRSSSPALIVSPLSALPLRPWPSRRVSPSRALRVPVVVVSSPRKMLRRPSPAPLVFPLKLLSRISPSARCARPLPTV